MSSSRPVDAKAIKAANHRRVAALWNELVQQNSVRTNPTANLPEGSRQILMEYAEELTMSLLDAASSVAECRGSKTVEESDIALLLGNFPTFI